MSFSSVVDRHTRGLLWRHELGIGWVYSGCGLSPCGDEELVVLGITCTAAVCELLWLGNKTVVVGEQGD